MNHCPRCNEARELHNVCADGESTRLCSKCIAKIERDHMLKHGVIDLYIFCTTIDGKRIPSHVSNWINSPELHFNIFEWSEGRHNIAGTRTDVWFHFNGNVWWGLNLGDNDIVRCQRTKRKSDS